MGDYSNGEIWGIAGYVRFAPKATKLMRRNEPPLCADFVAKVPVREPTPRRREVTFVAACSMGSGG